MHGEAGDEIRVLRLLQRHALHGKLLLSTGEPEMRLSLPEIRELDLLSGHGLVVDVGVVGRDGGGVVGNDGEDEDDVEGEAVEEEGRSKQNVRNTGSPL